MKTTKMFSAMIAGCIFAAAMPLGMSASGYERSLPSPDEIRAFYQANSFTLSWRDPSVFEYEQELTAPYKLGKLDLDTQQEALNALNLCRYIAGLPADVTFRADLSEKAQAASLLNYCDDNLDHNEHNMPVGMDEQLYQMGLDALKQCNIEYGPYSLPDALIKLDMCDHLDVGTVGLRNIDCVGHRRWVLNPDMVYTGFGQTQKYSAMYMTDTSRDRYFTGDYIAWPPENMPYELYHFELRDCSRYPFSVQLNEEKYEMPDPETVTVDLTSQKQGKTWHLDKNSKDVTEFLNVDLNYIATPSCIVFSVEQFFDIDDVIDVTVSGIRTALGEDTSIHYQVRFFNLETDANEENDPPAQTADLPAVVMAGDLNGDGVMTVSDAVALARVVGEDKSIVVTDEMRNAADINHDGKTDVRDLTRMLKLLAGKNE